jgi:hypothetical protein
VSSLIYFEGLALLVLGVVAFTAALQVADKHSARFRAFLDRHVGEEPEWLRPW